LTGVNGRPVVKYRDTLWQRCTQVSNVKSPASLKSLWASLKSSLKSLRASRKSSRKFFRSSLKSSLKSFTSSPKSSLKSLPTLSCLPCLGRSFTNYVTHICVSLTHPTHMTYYGDTFVNETNTIPPSTILKISLFQSTYLLFILQDFNYEHTGPMKLLRNCRLNYAHQQIVSLKVSCINIVL